VGLSRLGQSLVSDHPPRPSPSRQDKDGLNLSIRNICVYCGASSGRNPLYAEGARALAQELVRRNIGLVYGGASVGVMGTVANAVLERGGRVVGVIPEALLSRELAHHGLTELRVTKSMHERKAVMAELADGFIALPGGIGTFEEIFEAWTWAQLGFHAKPCGILNVAGYFDRLIEFLNQAAEEEFIKPQHREMLIVESDPLRILDRFEGYRAPPVTKWIAGNET
jgi:uncharacterized protein (TIGR00730 family)